MIRISNYLKMRVLGALEYAEGDSPRDRYMAVSQMTFRDEDGHSRQFTWHTIQPWWYNQQNEPVSQGIVFTNQPPASQSL